MKRKALALAAGEAANEHKGSSAKPTLVIGVVLGLTLFGLTTHHSISNNTTSNPVPTTSNSSSTNSSSLASSISTVNATQFLNHYYSTVVDAQQRAGVRQAMLTDAYRQNDPTDVYNSFWSQIHNVLITNVTAKSSPAAFSAYLTYTSDDGTTKPAELTNFTLACATSASPCPSNEILINTETPVSN